MEENRVANFFTFKAQKIAKNFGASLAAQTSQFCFFFGKKADFDYLRNL